VAWQTWRRQAPHWWQPATLGVHIPMPIRNNAIMLLDCKTGMKILTLTMRKRLMDRPVWCTNPWVCSCMTDVCVEEVMKLINVMIDGPQWKEKGDDPHLRSRLFWQWVVPIIPPHLALAFDQVEVGSKSLNLPLFYKRA
jgi:hypothetical protein